MSPASKNEIAKITECDIKIKYIEQHLKELKQDLRKHVEGETETKRYISNKRLVIYLAIASILSGIITKLLDLIIV